MAQMVLEALVGHGGAECRSRDRASTDPPRAAEDRQEPPSHGPFQAVALVDEHAAVV
jgi:hypothetical protein